MMEIFAWVKNALLTLKKWADYARSFFVIFDWLIAVLDYAHTTFPYTEEGKQILKVGEEVNEQKNDVDNVN